MIKKRCDKYENNSFYQLLDVNAAGRHSGINCSIGKNFGPTYHFFDLYQGGLRKEVQSNEL